MDFVEVVSTLLTAKIFEEKLPPTAVPKWRSCQTMDVVVGCWRGGPTCSDFTCFINRFVGVIASNLSEESRASDFVSILCFLF